MRDDLQAAMARAEALERELSEARRQNTASAQQMAELRATIAAQRAQIRRARWGTVATTVFRHLRSIGVVAAALAFVYVVVLGRCPSRRSDESSLSEGKLARRCDEGRAVSCFYLGRKHEQAGRHAEAIRAYARSCAIGGAGAGCYNEGVLRFRQGDQAGAEAPFARACQHYNHVAACGNYAHLLLARKAYTDAEWVARRGCAKRQVGPRGHTAPPDSNSCNNLSIALWRQGRIAEARTAGRRSCEGGLDLGCAAWAHMALLLKDRADAREAFTRGWRLNRERGALIRVRGHSALLDGNHDAALADYRQAIRLAEHNPAEQQQRVRALQQRPELEEILDDLMAIQRAYPEKSALIDRARIALKP